VEVARITTEGAARRTKTGSEDVCFRREPSDHGTEPHTKGCSNFGDKFKGRVKSGWILIPSSGQVYGIIGTATLAIDALEDQVVSNHVIRIAPRPSSVPVGYVLTVLSHPVFGRPLVKSLAFGSSVPEIDPDDLATEQIVRLDPKEESAISDLAEAAAQARAAAESARVRDQCGCGSDPYSLHSKRIVKRQIGRSIE
jgi:hypothetical protein